MNPKVFEGFTDHEGGEWIRFKSGIYKDVCWRPYEIMMEEENMTYKIEFLQGEGFVTPKDEDTHFQKVCGETLLSMLTEAAALEVAETEQADDSPKIIVP